MSDATLRIAVVGAGSIGRTLAAAWARTGHRVTLGARDPGSDATASALARIAAETATAPGAPPVEAHALAAAVAGADAVLLAVPGAVAAEVITGLGPALADALVIDATNDIAGTAPSAAEALRAAAPHAIYVRAFNTLGWENLADPLLDGERADLLWAGPDGPPGTTVERLIADVGLRPVRIGGAEDAAVLDGVTRLWFQLAFRAGHGRRVAFKVLTG